MTRWLPTALLGLVVSGPLLQAAASPRDQWGVALLELGSNPDARQEQLALRDCLGLLGIPFVATTDVERATRYPLVLTGGILVNAALRPSQRETLYSYVERGGVLFSTQVQGNIFFPLFGLAGASPQRSNFRVFFNDYRDPALRYFNRQEEFAISLGDPKLYKATVWSTEYRPGLRTKVLARYENGSAALTLNAYGRGLAYALGLGFKETTLIPQIARSFEAARAPSNFFEPSGDVFRLIVRGLYEGNVHPFLLLHSIPEGKQTALVLSHDVDARESFHNSLDFARLETSLGVRSTFYVTAKYFQDATDIGYYTPDRLAWIHQVKELGFEIGSHSVSHSKTFDKFPVGSPQVDLQSYQPTAQPTLFGEVKVSKQLLDRDLHQNTTLFRAGELEFPSDLLAVLEQSGYLFDSSISAQDCLTNFPYLGFLHRVLGSEHSKIVVVPVALDDSQDYLTAQSQETMLRTWTEVIRANAENGAMTCLLIHPTDVTYKLKTERRLIETIRGDDAWIGDVGTLARFWKARALLQPVVRSGSEGAVIVLNLKRADLPSGQALVIEVRSGQRVPQVQDAAGRPVAVRVRQAKDRAFLLLP